MNEEANGNSLHSLVGLSGFRCIVADPPWRVLRPSGWGKHNHHPSVELLPYRTLSVTDIAAMPMSMVSANRCHLYLWTINKHIESAYTVARSWGFTPSTLLVWAKTPRGMGLGGHYALTTEFCLFARKGKDGPKSTQNRINTTWWNWCRGRHSAKPEAFQDMVETVSPGPYLELFARRPRLNWTVWGNEVEANG